MGAETIIDNSTKEELKNVTEAQEIWNKCTEFFQEHIGSLEYRTWFEPISAKSFENSTLVLRIPNRIHWEFIEEHYITLLKAALKSIIGEDARFNYIIEENEDDNDIPETFTPVADRTKREEVKPKVVSVQPDPDFETGLIDRLTFENFIEGKGNQFARAAAVSIANNPFKNSYNPLFIYSGVGLGKTHLVHAIGNAIIHNKKARKVKYTTAEKFLNDFVDSIQKRIVNQFTAYYRDVDVLIIDDIQFLAGKEGITNTFFHLFNELHMLGKQIILTSDKPPKNLIGLEERLISRFQWGLSVDMQPPDLETRMAILLHRCGSMGVEIAPEIIEYIAFSITNNIRELEGSLIKLLAQASLQGRQIDMTLAKEVVSSIATVKKSNITIEVIQKVVAEYFGVPEDYLRAKTKKQEVVLPRQVAMYFCKKLTSATLKTIGLHFGGRDHSTVIHAIAVVEEAMINDNFLKTINSINKQIEFSV